MQRFFDHLGRGDVEAALALATGDAILDRRLSNAPWRGLVRGRGAMREAYAELADAVDDVSWEPTDVRELGNDMVVIGTRISVHGRASGISVIARGGWLLTFDGDLIREGVLHQSFDAALLAARQRRLAAARLYFVCEARPGGRDPRPLLDAALAGGVDLVQLRDKDADERLLLSASAAFRAAADRAGGLFFVNDRPDLVEAGGADGVHVGQDDIPVADARRIAGPAALVGLSTHSPEQFDAAVTARGADRPDQVSAGPVWETPTKQGRPAAGLELIRHAAAGGGDAPWFAIGGIDVANVGEVVAAGARRIVVVRAIRDAADPESAARELRAALR